jgi:hypothetical protein
MDAIGKLLPGFRIKTGAHKFAGRFGKLLPPSLIRKRTSRGTYDSSLLRQAAATKQPVQGRNQFAAGKIPGSSKDYYCVCHHDHLSREIRCPQK